MTIQRQESKMDEEFEREVIRFLRDNPGFFENHADLLSDMILTHESGSAVSLVEKQLSVLRDQKTELRKRLNNLVATARQNELLIERIHKLTLELLDARSLDDALKSTCSQLQANFDADAVAISLFNPADDDMARTPWFEKSKDELANSFDKIIRGCKPVCGKFSDQQLALLFKDENIASAALIPLCATESRDSCYGLLAIGSADEARFRVDMGVLFLDLIGNILSRVLRPYLSG